MANKVYVAVSLDGYIARKNGSIDWLSDIPNPEGSDFGFSEFINSIDAIVMGRKTFEQVLTFGEWPYSKPVFVLSNSLSSLPDNLTGKAEIINGDPYSIIDKLNSRGFMNLYIDGGNTIQEFISSRLIDELIITTVPVLLGEGIPLFGNNIQDQWFDYSGTEVLNNMLVKNHYKKMSGNKK